MHKGNIGTAHNCKNICARKQKKVIFDWSFVFCNCNNKLHILVVWPNYILYSYCTHTRK